jgi:hypothetical protein
MVKLPTWTKSLNDEDWQFLKRFLLADGSLKALAQEYAISYPTVRIRLDRLIEKVRAADQSGAVDEFHRQLRVLVAEGRMDSATARQLLEVHLATIKEKDHAEPGEGTPSDVNREEEKMS